MDNIENQIDNQVNPENIDANQNETTNPTTPSNNDVKDQKPGSRKKLSLLLSGIAILVLLGVLVYVISRHHSKPIKTVIHSPLTVAVNKTKPASGTNTWTGNDNNYNWNDAKNWSLGTPSNNQVLEINMSTVKQPTDQYGATEFAFNDNIPNLSINKLIIDGSVGGFIFKINGQPLTVTNGIEDTTTQTNTNSALPQATLANTVKFSGSQTIKVTGRNLLTFYSIDDAMDIASGTTLDFATTTSYSQISVMGPISGSGSLNFAKDALSTNSVVNFYDASPKFSGNVTIGSGDIVGIGNATATGFGSVDAFGTGTINIQRGGSLLVFAAGTDTVAVNNDITVSGNGITQKDGTITGAIYGCITPAQEGCSNSTVVFSGAVKLLGDTQIGTSTPASLGADNTHVDYKFSNLDKNNYSLRLVNDYALTGGP